MNASQTPPWYVLTGGPCAGKTTTVELLKARGHEVRPEPGRLYFEEQFKQGKTIEELLQDVPKLEREMLLFYAKCEVDNSKDSTLFLDRAVPDCLGYYRVYDVPEDEDLRAALEKTSYRKVFLLDLIEKFENDAVRVETPEQARRIHEAIREAYTELGYEIVDVPVMPVDERVDYILARLD